MVTFSEVKVSLEFVSEMKLQVTDSSMWQKAGPIDNPI